jgi:hypothetical protein
MTSGDYSEKMKVRGNDEISKLSKAINELTEIVIVITGYWQRNLLTKITQDRLLPFIARAWAELSVGIIILLFAAILVDMSPKAAQRGNRG